MQKRESLIHFKRDLCFLKLTGKSNLKVRKSYSSGSQSPALEILLVSGAHKDSHRRPKRSPSSPLTARVQSNDDGYFAATTSLACPVSRMICNPVPARSAL